MELGYIWKAVRRWWWIVAALGVLGGLPGLLIKSGRVDRFASEAVLLITPPSDSQLQISFASDPDRYVLGQLSLLGSESMAGDVVERIGGELTLLDVQAAVTFTQDPKTDVVTIRGITESGGLSQQVVQAFVDLYFEAINAQVDAVQDPEIERLNGELADVEEQLAAVDAQIADVLKPYLPELPLTTDAGQLQIPSIDQVAPALATQRTILQQQYDQLLTAQGTLELNNRLRVTSQVVQPATLPTLPAVGPVKLLVIGGGVAGALLGCLVAVLVARHAREVLSPDDITEHLGVPDAGSFPHTSAYAAHDRATALLSVPPPVVPFVDELCVRIESHGRQGSVVALFIGIEHALGTTTLAAAAATRFAAMGRTVALVDLSVRNPELSQLFAQRTGGIGALLSSIATQAAAKEATPRARSSEGRRRADPFRRTPVAGLQVLGAGSGTEPTLLRRSDVDDLVRSTRETFDVVLFDGGVLLESPAALHLARTVDVTVAMLDPHQRIASLELLRREVDDRVGQLLPVKAARRLSLFLPWRRHSKPRKEVDDNAGE